MLSGHWPYCLENCSKDIPFLNEFVCFTPTRFYSIFLNIIIEIHMIRRLFISIISLRVWVHNWHIFYHEIYIEAHGFFSHTRRSRCKTKKLRLWRNAKITLWSLSNTPVTCTCHRSREIVRNQLRFYWMIFIIWTGVNGL